MRKLYRMNEQYSGTFRLVWVVLWLMCLLPGMVSAQGKPLDAKAIANLRTRVKETAHATSTIACDFRQEKEMGLIAEKIITTGKFLLKKEKKLRWEYTDPFSYIIVIDNDRISIKDDKKVSQFNIQSNKVFLEINRVILGSIQGTLFNDRENFSATFYENPTAWIVKLKTLKPQLRESISEIVIWFNRKDYSVLRLDMNESSGDFTRITLNSRKTNQPIGDEMFVVN